MESSLQSSRGLKTFQSRDFLNGIKGWEDLHLEFWCQTHWDIFPFLPSTSSLCSTERISFGTEIWRGYYYYSHHPHNPAPLSPDTRSPRRPAPRCPWWPDCSLLYASQCWPSSRRRWQCGLWPGRWSLAARQCAGRLKDFYQLWGLIWGLIWGLTQVLDQTVELGSFSLGFADGCWLGQNWRGDGGAVGARRDLCHEIFF